MPIPQVYSIHELAARSKLSVYTLQTAIKNGQLKAFKADDAPNSALKVTEEDFLAWLELRKNALATSNARNKSK